MTDRKKELDELYGQAKALLEGKISEAETVTTTEKGRVATIDPEQAKTDTAVKAQPDLKNFMITKALRGMLYGNWTDAALEKEYIKAMVTDVDTAGGFLLPEPIRLDFIAALTAEAVVRRAGAFVTSLGPGEGETAKIPRGGQVSGAWVGQGTGATEQTPTIGNIQLTLKEWVTAVHIHDRLIRAASPIVEPIVRQMIVKAGALAEDLALIQGAGGALEPLGLISQPGILTSVINAPITFDHLLTMMSLIEQADGTYTAWIMNPRTKNTLRGIKDTAGQYIYAVDPGAAIRDTLFGLPVLFTTQIPTNLGAGTNESYILLGNWANYYILDGGAIEITADASERFSFSEVVVKGMLRVDGAPAQPKEFCIGTGVRV